MRSSRGFLLAFVALAACGAPPEPKAGRHAVLTRDKDPSSSEWIYVTRGMQGSRETECKTVLVKLRGEAKCRRALCKPAAHLAEDWTALCGSRLAADATEVRSLEGKLRAELRPAEDRCETEFEDIMSSSCTPSGGDDCLGRAERWATQCGSEYGTPLVLTMLSVRAERTAGERVVLDPRSCDDFLAELVNGLSCGNLPACEDRLQILADYRTRCSPADKRFPLTQALVLMAVQAAAQRPAEPIPLSDVALKPNLPFLPLADGQGAVVRVGWSHPSSFEAYADAVGAAGVDVHVARVFRSAEGQPELRLGALAAPEGRTLGERFASLRVRSETEDLQATATSVLKLKLTQASEAPSSRDAAARVLEGLGAFSEIPVLPQSARAALRESDKALKGLCRWLGEEKSRLLSKFGERHTLVASTRRSERMPFADVSNAGDVIFASGSLAAFHDAITDMPECAIAYSEGLAYLSGRVRTIKLPNADEDKLAGDADAKTAHCVAVSQQLAQLEQKVSECVFGVRQCSEEEADGLAQDYEKTTLVLRRARLEARIATASLREDLRTERATRLVRECFEATSQ